VAAELLNPRSRFVTFAGKQAHQKLDYEFFKNFESPHTRRNYRLDIQHFRKFMAEYFPEVRQLAHIERAHLVAYRNYLQEELDLAPKTINRRFSSLSTYFAFLVEKGLRETNPVSCIRRPRQEVRHATSDLSDEEVRALFRVVESRKVSSMHRTLIHLLFSTGMRKAEVINLRIKNFKHQGPYHYLEFRAKGGKYLIKTLHPRMAEMLQIHLDQMRAAGRSMRPEDYIFRRSKNPKNPRDLEGKLAPTSVDYIVQLYARQAGIDHHITPHSARATYIGAALEAGVDLLTVSQDVGHASVKTTQEYNKRRQKMASSPALKLNFFKRSA